MRLIILVLPMAIALPAPLLAASPETTTAASPAVETSTPAKPPKPKKICRQAEEQSGSRIGSGRVCKTAEEWAEVDVQVGNRNSGKASRSFESN